MKSISCEVLLLSILIAAPSVSALEMPLQPGDHVVYIGNTLADRMQHHAWLETYTHALLPDYHLTFRNLGFSGDEITLRQRAENFGDADQWLTKCDADVVACFFGYNESLKGDDGLKQFSTDLAQMIDHMRAQKYNGQSTPRLIVFSPIAHEDLKSPHLPDGSVNNRNLAKYTEVMRQICEQKSVPFVDLFSIAQQLYRDADHPLTMNGIHLLDHGNKALARAIIAQFAPDQPLPGDDAVAKLREAVLDKNYHWFSRYRVIDEYNVFGGRSRLSWFGQSNADVMMREMEIFDVMTANRDKRIWAVAQGGDLDVRDDNLPPELVVKPNRQGPLEGGAFPYLGGEEAIEKMQIDDGLQVNLFASEEQFPRLVNPVQMAVDTNSRLWVSVWPSYPHWNPTEARRDALVILPDEDNDGRADELIVFADELNSITGFEFWGGGVLVAAPPEIWFLKDTDGDDKADYKLRMLQGLSSADTHHSANAMLIGPDGWLYWSRGIFNVAAFETPTKTFRSGTSGVYRFNPRTFEIEFHYPIGPNPHGDVFDRWGFQFANDATSGTGGYVSIGKGLRPGDKQWFEKEWRPVAATGILSSSHFPEKYQDNFLICNTIGFLGILQYNVTYNGAEIRAIRTNDLLRSTDENFRPVDLEIGGDGALYVADWHNVLIGHMQHNMRDPNRDHEHGRIYRVSANGRESLSPVKMKGKPIAEVLQDFFSRENGVRYRARLELSGRDSSQVVAEIAAFVATLDPANDDPQHDEAQALLECVWVHEEQRIPNLDLVKKTFHAKEPRVRAAAIRSLGHWAGKVDGWESTLIAAARDASPLVRAEAAKAAVEFQDLTGAEVVFEVATRPLDPELDDVVNYARQSINVDAMIAQIIQSGRKLSPAAVAYALQHADPTLLLQMEKSPAVFRAILSRGKIPTEQRWQAIHALAREDGRPNLEQLIACIRSAENENQESLGDLADMLAGIANDQLTNSATALRQLAEDTSSSSVRKAAYAAWLRSGDARQAWTHASQSGTLLADALSAIQKVEAAETRDTLFPLVRSLMFELPENLRSADHDFASSGEPAVAFEYYEPHPAQNVALETLDQATPKFTGRVGRFVTFVPDGRTDAFATRQSASILVPATGEYAFFTNSDDGSRLYMDQKLVVDNDGLHGMSERRGTIRLDAGLHEITVTYFDNGGGDGLEVSWQGPGVEKQPIREAVLRPSGGGDPRARALEVIAAWPGHVDEKIDDFFRLLSEESRSAAALTALSTLPAQHVADRLSAAQSNLVVEKVLTQAETANPVGRQTEEFANLLALGASLLGKATIDTDLAKQKLNTLKASIPVKADPAVMALGQEVYSRDSHCATCHQPHGQGLPNLYPPLDGSLWATGSEERMIRLALDGMHGTIEVKGKRYSSPPLPPMTGFRHLLTDEELAAVLTYVRNSWTNRAKPVAASQVARIRGIDRGENAAFWTANELLALYPLEDGGGPIADPSTDGWAPKFVKEWKLEDLLPNATEIHDRSFPNGRLLFERVGCAQCHKLADVGGVLGPNLAELEPKKRTAEYILQAVITPSRDVDPKYAVQTYYLDSGQIVSGFLVKETDSELHVLSDPLNQSEPTVVPKSQIEEQTKTANSIMPQGLLNWLEHEEVLDLIAYVLAGGDEKHEIYRQESGK